MTTTIQDARRRYSCQKAREHLRQLDQGGLLQLLHRAIEMLPEEQLPVLFKDYVFPDKLLADTAAEPTLTEAVHAFRNASMAGKFYQSFNVNSRNCMEKSAGTHRWIAECHQLLDWACRLVDEGQTTEPREAFGVVIELLNRINEDPGAIIFFADEAGAWQVNVNWETVLPAYFKVLAATTKPKVYARTVLDVIEEHVDFERVKFTELARSAATEEGRAALNLLAKA